MIETQSIELSQRTAIDHIREVCGHPSESHSFASLFLWQRDMGLTIGLAEDAYIVRCASRSPNCWYFPCGDRRQVTDWIQELLARPEPLELIYLLEEDARVLEARVPGEFRIEPSDGDSEYLYDRSTYLAMEGESYRRIRRGVRKLCAEHDVNARLWTSENDRDMETVLRIWHAGTPGEDGLIDWGTSRLLLTHGKELGIIGVVVYVDGDPAAMSAGFPLTADSFDIAFSKSILRLDGLPDYTRQALARRLPDQYRILNGEDDLGIPGIRTVKQLMRPIGQINMFEARRS